MIDTGWEIRPAGWILLVILGLLLIFGTIRWFQHILNKNSEHI